MSATSTAQAAAEELIRRYYAAFNAGDAEGMLALLTDDVAHDINQGTRETGLPAFRAFMARMNAHYREELRDIVVMVSADGRRGAAEFTVHGTYLATDEGLPEARGQTYILPAGAFFELRDGRIARVTNYYNLADWVAQVGG
ncbi:ketosteroid isomerase-related protein [Roseomonas marmotae]|uniref:Nuclear transport factor 2 family protein n=1 Tax=Roseomonas marmotae TaxID=2768161 RepID=A0ABS3KFH8_9PROT|nr:ketosteroid isomerase-related protein [Roseomonas marmotae]MBO1075695.1 nuclear transport factor 2 family protein [Roseomonas marmotae]QTI80427.1 nuclear transport factor 2 family protein [Roseomonas marmotae]